MLTFLQTQAFNTSAAKDVPIRKLTLPAVKVYICFHDTVKCP